MDHMDIQIRKYACDILEKELEHKKEMNRAYFWRDVIFMFYDRIKPILEPIFLELIKTKIREMKNPQKSWHDIINLKRAFYVNEINYKS